MECGAATSLTASFVATLLCALLALFLRWPELTPPYHPAMDQSDMQKNQNNATGKKPPLRHVKIVPNVNSSPTKFLALGYIQYLKALITDNVAAAK